MKYTARICMDCADDGYVFETPILKLFFIKFKHTFSLKHWRNVKANRTRIVAPTVPVFDEDVDG